jgi:hypothetical protein
MEKDFFIFLEQLKEAVTKVDAKYINISVIELPNNIYRERVFCYELYHQLRKLLGDDYKYMLDGELDKKSHPIIYPKIPDFVIHYRGEMGYNLAIIEVKPIKSIYTSITNLEDDLDKIIDFIEVGEYHYGIMLIYSNGVDLLNKNIIKVFKERTSSHPEKIFLLWYPRPNLKPEIISN